MRPTGTRAVRPGRGMDRGDGALVQDECHREPSWALPGPPRGDPPAARVVRRGRDRGPWRVRGTAPLPAPRDGLAAERARADPASQGRHRGRRGSASGRSSRRLGSAARPRARAAGPRGRSRGGRVDTRRARASDAGAVQGAPAGHRSAARAATRGADRDRDRGRRHRSSALGRRPADSGGRPVRQQGAGRQRDPWPGEGAARRGRQRRTRSGSAPKPRDSGARSGRPTRRHWRSVAFADALRASGREQRAALELEAARTVLDRIEAEQPAR